MIPGLDGLRAIAYLVVFFYHIDYLKFGWAGVQLFFVLSGFLITDILLRMKEILPIGEYFKKFYLRRFLRIFPLYYFFLFLMLGVSAWFISVSYRPFMMSTLQDQLPYAFIYVYNFYIAYREYLPSPFLDHLWSLSVEEQFYLAWPLLIFLTKEKWLKKIFLAGIVAGPLFRVALFVANDMGFSRYLQDSFPGALYALPFTHLDAFAFGAYISRFAFPHAGKQLVLLGLLLPAAGLLSYYLDTGEAGTWSSLGFLVALPNGYQFLWAYTFINYWFALLIYCVVKERLFVRFLEFPPLRYLGKISYGLYVYHLPVIWFSVRVRDLEGMEATPRLPLYFLAFVVTILISSISYHIFEAPLIRLKDRVAAYARDGERTPSMR
jgi:peptidoglycan/LPS O-acetylase OafA/YrhL